MSELSISVGEVITPETPLEYYLNPISWKAPVFKFYRRKPKKKVYSLRDDCWYALYYPTPHSFRLINREIYAQDDFREVIGLLKLPPEKCILVRSDFLIKYPKPKIYYTNLVIHKYINKPYEYKGWSGETRTHWRTILRRERERLDKLNMQKTQNSI